MKNFIIRFLHKHGWYRFEDLTVGGNCGLCGSFMLEVFTVWWRWGLCNKCALESEE